LKHAADFSERTIRSLVNVSNSIVDLRRDRRISFYVYIKNINISSLLRKIDVYIIGNKTS